MAHGKRWHPSQESDELVFAVCDRFLSEMARRYDRHAQGDGGTKRHSAAAVADWIQKRWDRRDLTREKIYPLFGKPRGAITCSSSRPAISISLGGSPSRSTSIVTPRIRRRSA